MLSLAGFRPPQFSEDDVWLPSWLQICGMEQFDAECSHNELPTFQQRIVDLRCPHVSISNGESSREHGGCNIGHLFLSGTSGSPFSYAHSTENVAQFHLRLLSDEYSENTNLASEECRTKSESHCSAQLLENLAVSSHQKGININPVHDSRSLSESPTGEVVRPAHTNEMSMHEDNLKSPEAADAVELCIAASEALVIDEVTRSDSSLKSVSASAILEASLQVKQARLEIFVDPFSGSINDASGIDDLSDLDDPTMGSAFEDVGLNCNEFLGNDLSISRVKDTLDSECNENIKLEKTGGCVTNYVESNDDRSDHELNASKENIILATECNSDGTQEKVPDNLVVDLGNEGASDNNDCSGSIQSQPISRFSVSKEKVSAPAVEENCRETDVVGPSNTNYRDAEKETQPIMIQERFQSRWFGGWTWNKPENEMKSVTTVKHNIPKPFAGETSFFSESPDVALDGNSFVQHKDERADLASQLSAPSQNCPNSTNLEILLSQDVRSSSLSLTDLLCSVVPCSLSENIWPSPTINHNDGVFTGHFVITNEQTKENQLETSALGNELASWQGIDLPRANTNESPRVSRKITSLGYLSKGSSINVETFVEDCHKKRPFPMAHNPKFTSHAAPLVDIEENVKDGADRSFLQKENSSDGPLTVDASTHHHFEPSTSIHGIRNLAAFPEINVKCQSPENAKSTLSKCKIQDTQLPTSKRVRFSENVTNTADKRKPQKTQTTSNNGFPSGASRRSTRSCPHIDSRAQQLDRFLTKNIVTEKKRLILQNMDFVLTGFSCQKEKEIEGLIRKYGGTVLSQIPPVNLKGKRSAKFKPQTLPIVLCLKKIQSIKFLYGCAVNALILRVNWLIESIASGLLLPSKKYMVLPRNIGRIHAQVYTAVNYERSSLVFNNMGIMLHGNTKSFSHIGTIIKHGGGQVFKSLQRLVQSLEAGNTVTGMVVADDEKRTSRHLKQCASEKNIPVTSVYWIIRSLYAGRLIPLNGKRSSSLPTSKLHEHQDPMQLSQEI